MKMEEVMTTKNSRRSSASGKKETKGSSGLKQTLQKALDSVLAAPGLQVGQTAPFIPSRPHPSTEAPLFGSKTALLGLPVSTTPVAKALRPANAPGNTYKKNSANPLSAKYLPEALCSRVAPCWLCRYVRTFLCLEKLRGINPTPLVDRRRPKSLVEVVWHLGMKTRRTHREDLDRRWSHLGPYQTPGRRNGPRDRRYPKPLFHHPV